MKKSLLFVSISLVALLGITSCNNNSNDSSSTSPVSSSTTVTSSSTTNPSSTTTPASSSSSTTPSGFEDDTPKPTEENLPEGTVVRDYNPSFDTMVDDFSGETSTGTLSDTGATYQSKPYLKVALHSKWDEGTTSDSERMVPTTPDRAIYKMATGTYDLVSMDAIGFRVRLAKGSTPIALSNLIFGCRGADTVQVYPINLANAVDADSSPLEEIGYEYKDLMISVKNSVDDNVMYANPDGTASSLQVTSTMLGFHLYATGDFKGDIEIEEVFAIKGSTRTVIDNFNRATVGNGLENAYWAGSTGTIEGRRAVINEGGSYKVSKADATPAANVALSVKGDSTGLTVTPVKANGDEGTAVAWSELKDSEGKALPTEDVTYYIPLRANGLEKGDGTLHIHAGAYNGIKGSLTITALGTYNYVPNTKVVMAENKEVSNNAYNYICGNDGHIAGPKYLTMVVTGDLSTMRIEDAAGNEWWAKDGKIILADGSVLDASTPFAEETTIVIDLVATGLSNNVQIHIHNGGAVDTTVTYKSITLTADNLNYSEIMSSLFPAEVE